MLLGTERSETRVQSKTTPILQAEWGMDALLANGRLLATLTIAADALRQLPHATPLAIALLWDNDNAEDASVTEVFATVNQLNVRAEADSVTLQITVAQVTVPSRPPQRLRWCTTEELVATLAAPTDWWLTPTSWLGAMPTKTSVLLAGNAQGAKLSALITLIDTLPNGGILIDTTGYWAHGLAAALSPDSVSLQHYTASALPLHRFALPHLFGALLASWPVAWQQRAWEVLTTCRANTLGGACQHLLDHFPTCESALRPYLPQPQATPIATSSLAEKPTWQLISLAGMTPVAASVVIAQLLDEVLALSPATPVMWVSPDITAWTRLQRWSSGVLVGVTSPYDEALVADNRLELSYAWPLEVKRGRGEGSIASDVAVTADLHGTLDIPPHDVVVTAMGSMTYHLPLRYMLSGSHFPDYQIALPVLPAAATPVLASWSPEEPVVTDPIAIVVPETPALSARPMVDDILEEAFSWEAELDDMLAPGEVAGGLAEAFVPVTAPRLETTRATTDGDAMGLGNDAVDVLPLAAVVDGDESDSAAQQPSAVADAAPTSTPDDGFEFALPGEALDLAGASFPMVTSSTTVAASAEVTAPNGMAVGTRVNHPRYGEGVVEGVIPTGKRITLRIRFADVGKRLLDAEQSNLTIV